jgi:hypothetical protein
MLWSYSINMNLKLQVPIAMDLVIAFLYATNLQVLAIASAYAMHL